MFITNEFLFDVLTELQRRNEHVFNKYVPTEQENHNQLSFHKSNAKIRLGTGGNQSGKSYMAAYEIACWLTNKHPYLTLPKPPYVIWCISVEYSTLKAGIYRHLKNLIPDWEIEKLGPTVVGHPLPSYIKMKNGNVVEFKSAKGNEDARTKFQAEGVTLTAIDEEVNPELWTELEARTIVTGGKFIITATLIESYEWIIDLYNRGKKGDTDVFVTELYTPLNPYIDKATFDYLDKRWSDDIKEVRFFGKPRRFIGLVYNGFTKRHICKPFVIPSDWPKWSAFDPGYRTAATLWIAVNPQGRKYAYRELYAHHETLGQIALQIKKLEHWKLNKDLSIKFDHFVWEETEESEWMEFRGIDPKAKAKSEAGEKSIIDQLYERYGISCVEADNSLKPGIDDVRLLLQGEIEGEPEFQVFDTLENFIDEIKSYRHRRLNKKEEQHEPKDEPIRRKNHLMDCIRYISRERPKYRKPIHTYSESDLYLGINSNSDQLDDQSMAARIGRKRERELANEFVGSNW